MSINTLRNNMVPLLVVTLITVAAGVLLYRQKSILNNLNINGNQNIPITEIKSLISNCKVDSVSLQNNVKIALKLKDNTWIKLGKNAIDPVLEEKQKAEAKCGIIPLAVVD